MGYLDREYQRYEGRQSSGFGARLEGCPVVKWLLILNIAVFVLDIVMRPERPPGVPPTDQYQSALYHWGAFNIGQGLLGGQVWRLFSFQFLHGGFLHILFNMYALYMFGPFLEKWWRSRAFLGFYLMCGVAGALLLSLIAWVPSVLPGVGMDTNLIGASAGVFGVLIGVAVIAPKGQIRLLFPPIPMTLKTFAIALIVIETVLVLTKSSNAGGSVGHLGGALMGFLFFKVSALGNLLKKLEQAGGQKVDIVKKPTFKRRKSYEKKLKPKMKANASAGEVDRILDKINSEGLHSLTEEERKILQEASRK